MEDSSPDLLLAVDGHWRSMTGQWPPLSHWNLLLKSWLGYDTSDLLRLVWNLNWIEHVHLTKRREQTNSKTCSKLFKLKSSIIFQILIKQFREIILINLDDLLYRKGREIDRHEFRATSKYSTSTIRSLDLEHSESVSDHCEQAAVVPIQFARINNPND